jgi:hypothetical protein
MGAFNFIGRAAAAKPCPVEAHEREANLISWHRVGARLKILEAPIYCIQLTLYAIPSGFTKNCLLLGTGHACLPANGRMRGRSVQHTI